MSAGEWTQRKPCTEKIIVMTIMIMIVIMIVIMIGMPTFKLHHTNCFVLFQIPGTACFSLHWSVSRVSVGPLFILSPASSS